jgi:uncharacterized membrane protein
MESAVARRKADEETTGAAVRSLQPWPPNRTAAWQERAIWWYVLVAATVVGLFSMRYVLPNPPFFLHQMRNHFLLPRELTMHAIAGSIALLLGPWQLLPYLRTAHPRVHRWLGRIYVADVLVAWLLALLLMPTVATGFPAASAFFLAGLLWIGCAALGVVAIRRGDVRAHRRWMLRSYAMAFAAVTIRLYVHPARELGIPFEYRYPAGLWLAVLTNIAAVETMLRWPSTRGASLDRRHDGRASSNSASRRDHWWRIWRSLIRLAGDWRGAQVLISADRAFFCSAAAPPRSIVRGLSPRYPPAMRPRHDGIAARAVLDDMPIHALPLQLPRRRDLDAQRRAAVQARPRRRLLRLRRHSERRQ